MAPLKTILFVHGTGTREDAYEANCRQIESQLPEFGRALDCKVVLQKCYWGHLGSHLYAGGLSIPEYGKTGGQTPTPEQVEIALWEHLYEDPLYELRTLTLRGPAQSVKLGAGQGAALLKKLAALSPERFAASLTQTEAADLFPEAVQSVAKNPVSTEALLTASGPLGEYRIALARAVVARLAELTVQSNRVPVLDFNLALRNQLVSAITDALGGADKALGGWILNTLWGIASRFGGQRAMEQNRGGISDMIQPFIGDILVYQANGAPAQKFIRERIAAAEGDVIVVAHSLGGVASFDLLCQKSRPENVKLLATVGSQVPMLYEMRALQSIVHPARPDEFIPWLNIYDPADFLSYQADKLFPGLVTDVIVHNGRRFPESHVGYWANPETWQALITHLRK